MQNKYVSDVGDFGKFQLFRYLFNHTNSTLHAMPLSQIWFFHHGESESNNDGKHINYFERMKGCDAFLEKGLKRLIEENRRNLHALEALGLLEKINFFYEEIPKTAQERQIWFKQAMAFTCDSKVVAVAPDNGMALRCHKEEKRFEILKHSEHFSSKKEAHKYIFFEEIASLYHLPHIEITIVYQHLSRCFKHDEQIKSLLQTLEQTYPHVIAIKHKPYSPRVFFFLCKNEVLKEQVWQRLGVFCHEFGCFWERFR